MEDYEVAVPFQSLQALGCHVEQFVSERRLLIFAQLQFMIFKVIKLIMRSQCTFLF